VNRLNLLDAELEREGERDGYRGRSTGIGGRIGAEQIGGSVYALGDGQAASPHHFHYGVEEWVVVLDGTPRLRTPDGERELRRGDVVCFPSGPEGAHTVSGPGRVLMLSANRSPSISVYPDSQKLGTRPDHDQDRLNFRRSDAVDYWDGE
jgi:uncharacterized cupin superfamily protein